MSAPTTPGWYAYSGGRQTMIFHLRDTELGQQWHTYFDNGVGGDCDWGYIDQALSVYELVFLGGTEHVDAQTIEWFFFVAQSRAKGQCEFSGMRATRCVSSICDCFETIEGAQEIERLAGVRT